MKVKAVGCKKLVIVGIFSCLYRTDSISCSVFGLIPTNVQQPLLFVIIKHILHT